MDFTNGDILTQAKLKSRRGVIFMFFKKAKRQRVSIPVVVLFVMTRHTHSSRVYSLVNMVYEDFTIMLTAA